MRLVLILPGEARDEISYKYNITFASGQSGARFYFVPACFSPNHRWSVPPENPAGVVSGIRLRSGPPSGRKNNLAMNEIVITFTAEYRLLRSGFPEILSPDKNSAYEKNAFCIQS